MGEKIYWNEELYVRREKMKKKILLVILLLLVFLVASYVSVGAKTGTRVTGAMNYPDPWSSGWGWGELNIIIDPDGNLDANAAGFAKFRSYTVDDPKDWGGWYGSAVCGDLGEYDGNPAVVVVVEIEETTGANVFGVGQFMKFIIVDGGQNASEDMIGMITAPLVDDQPNCEFELPWFIWNAVGGNVTIH